MTIFYSPLVLFQSNFAYYCTCVDVKDIKDDVVQTRTALFDAMVYEFKTSLCDASNDEPF
jgi:hypothetical protein